MLVRSLDYISTCQVDTTVIDVLNVIIRPLTCPDSFRNNVKVVDVLTGTGSVNAIVASTLEKLHS